MSAWWVLTKSANRWNDDRPRPTDSVNAENVAFVIRPNDPNTPFESWT